MYQDVLLRFVSLSAWVVYVGIQPESHQNIQINLPQPWQSLLLSSAVYRSGLVTFTCFQTGLKMSHQVLEWYTFQPASLYIYMTWLGAPLMLQLEAFCQPVFHCLWVFESLLLFSAMDPGGGEERGMLLFVSRWGAQVRRETLFTRRSYLAQAPELCLWTM